MSLRHYDDWLTTFVEYASYGEAPLPLLYWTGVSTIAGALRRRVWVDQVFFSWVPNFYIVFVAEPGVIAKTTTANIGMRLLRQVEGINFGPDYTNWQTLIKKMGEIGEEFTVGNDYYPMAAMTVSLDELGTFLDPTNGEQVSALTDLWDGKQRDIWKATKTQGEDTLRWPWLNIIACTTPGWVGQNFPETLLQSGLLSRILFIWGKEKRQLQPYIAQAVPPGHRAVEAKLVDDLRVMSRLSGPAKMTPKAIEWGDKWYREYWGGKPHTAREMLGYPARKQSHLHKLALVISASRGSFPILTDKHLAEAEERLRQIEPDIFRVFEVIGTTGLTRAQLDIVTAVEEVGGPIAVSDLYGRYFFRRMSVRDYNEAVRGVIGSGRLIYEQLGGKATFRRREK